MGMDIKDNNADDIESTENNPNKETSSILTVDDVPLSRIYMQKLLESPEYNVIVASSGLEAIKVAEQRPLALILLDVQMPEMDGFETAEKLRSNEKTRNIPIIFVTAINRDQEYVFQGYQTGAVDYLLKPVDPIILRSKVKVFSELYLCQRLIESQLDEITKQKRLLQKQLEEIDTLSGFIPICASCKNIRNDDGYWEVVEKYISTRSDAQFSHAVCPDCAKKLYGDVEGFEV